MNKPYLVGITGGIGSGKTTVLKHFMALGIPAYEADKEAKRLMNKDAELISKIKEKFGDQSYIDCQLNTKYLSDTVFKDKQKLEELNALVHPAVRKDFKNWAENQNSKYVVYESALIIEYNQQEVFDEIILVTAPKKTRIERVKKRSNLSENEIKRRINKQISDNSKSKYVNYIIENINKRQLKDNILDINHNILNNILNNN